MRRYAAALLAVGVAGWIEAFVAVEWTYPYCVTLDDGPAYAVLGLPLPYHRFAGNSGEHLVLFHVYLLDVALLSLLLLPVTSWLLATRAPDRDPRLRRSAGSVGALLVLGTVALQATMLWTGLNQPRTSLVEDGYWNLRPVRLTTNTHGIEHCTPSHFWFRNPRRATA